MNIFDEEILNLWKSLFNHDVKYIMVGGFATSLHGFHRTTGDIDLWIKDTIENRKKLGLVFSELEIGDFENIETMQIITGWTTINLDSGFEVDIMTSIKGFEQSEFDSSFDFAPTAMIYDIPVKFLHLNQLIEAKKASGRQKDLLDILELEKIRSGKQKNK